MPYRADFKRAARPIEELRATIPGWGVDADPKDRPSYPKEMLTTDTGAHWDFPERMDGWETREHSIEHLMVPPVFGTAVPLKGLSGAMRRMAYRYGEGRARHWLMLIAADRVDVLESRFTALAHGRPDNLIAESGVMAEVHHHGIASRRQKRYDLKHQPIDYALMAAPYLLLGYAAYKFAQSRR